MDGNWVLMAASPYTAHLEPAGLLRHHREDGRGPLSKSFSEEPRWYEPQPDLYDYVKGVGDKATGKYAKAPISIITHMDKAAGGAEGWHGPHTFDARLLRDVLPKDLHYRLGITRAGVVIDSTVGRVILARLVKEGLK